MQPRQGPKRRLPRLWEQRLQEPPVRRNKLGDGLRHTPEGSCVGIWIVQLGGVGERMDPLAASMHLHTRLVVRTLHPRRRPRRRPRLQLSPSAAVRLLPRVRPLHLQGLNTPAHTPHPAVCFPPLQQLLRLVLPPPRSPGPQELRIVARPPFAMEDPLYVHMC